jgi:diguanylate cyclase (GGDEF)-like protein
MKRLLLCVGWLLAGLASSARAVEPPLDPALDSELSHLIIQAYDRPEASLQAVRAMRNTQSSPGALLQLRLAEAQILIQWGRMEQAEALIGALEREASAHDRTLLLRAQISERQGRFGEAGEFARDGLRRLEAQCPAHELARAIQQGRCDFRAAWGALRILERGESAQGGLAQAGATIQRALALAQAGQDRYLASVSMNTLALLSQELDQPDEARRWLALGLEQAQGDPMALSLNKVAEARVAVRRGDKRGQLNAYEEALEHAQRAEAPHTVAQIRVNLVDLHMHNGRPAVAMEEARLALPVLQSFRDLRLERTLRHNMGVSLLLLKQFDAARRELARAQQLAGEQPNPARRATELREIGQAWAASGQPREAITVFHAERALSAQIQARNRETQLQQLKLKYDSDRNQRDLDLLTRDRSLKDQQLANHELAQRVGMAVALLLGLSLVLVVVMLQRVRAANRQLKANQRLLRSQSERDPLTDLANRRHFLAVMQKQAQQLFTGGLLMIDIDHFKHVNDQQGHAVGDVVIRDVAQRIRDAVRTEDLVVRWGGEEFLVFAPNVSQDTLSLLAERVLNSVGGQPVATENGPLRVTVSIGFAHFPLPPGLLRQHWEQAVNWADMVLYTAKAQGRNRAVGIATVDAQDAAALLEIEADFDAACHSQRVRLLHIPGP